MIRLYGIPMSRASRCLWMLEELGVKYENVPISFIGDVKKPDYLKLNPNGRIPTLDDEGTLVWESLAINLHLARKYGKGQLWPDSETEQSHAIQWSIWAQTDVDANLLTVVKGRRGASEAERDPVAADQAEDALRGRWAVLESALAEHECLLGADFTVADLNVAAVVAGATIARVDLRSFSRLRGWLRRSLSRPAAQKIFALAMQEG